MEKLRIEITPTTQWRSMIIARFENVIVLLAHVYGILLSFCAQPKC
jgi:hypothetical protein